MKMLACPEINDLNLVDFIFLFEKNIFGFEVTVTNAVFMAISYCGHKLLEHQGRRLLGEVVLLHYKVEEFSPFAKLSYNIKVLLVLVKLQNFKDVGVVDFPQQAHFVHKLVLSTLALTIFVDNFHSHGLACHVVERFAAFSKGTWR